MSALTSPPSCLVHDIFWDSRAASSWPKVTLLRRHVNHTGSFVVMFRHHHTGSFLYGSVRVNFTIWKYWWLEFCLENVRTWSIVCLFF
jgi:hypothetical protein